MVEQFVRGNYFGGLVYRAAEIFEPGVSFHCAVFVSDANAEVGFDASPRQDSLERKRPDQAGLATARVALRGILHAPCGLDQGRLGTQGRTTSRRTGEQNASAGNA